MHALYGFACIRSGGDADCRAAAASLLASSALTKVGFACRATACRFATSSASNRRRCSTSTPCSGAAAIAVRSASRPPWRWCSASASSSRRSKPRRTGPAGSSAKGNCAMPRMMRMRRCGCSRRWRRVDGWRGGRRLHYIACLLPPADAGWF